MKRIWIGGLALVCVLLTGCGSLFAGDTRVELPTPPPEQVPSAKSAYRDMSQYDKYSMDGQDAFYISDYCSRDANDIIQFECLDYREYDCLFVYAYQAMLADGSGKMATELLSYNPLTTEHTVFFSIITDPSVEPAMWVQKVEGEEELYFIYFGGTVRFYLPDGSIYREVPLKQVYMKEMEKLGGIEDLSVLNVAVQPDWRDRDILSINLMGERITVNEDTEWTDEMMEDDSLLSGEGEEAQVFIRIDFHIADLSGGQFIRIYEAQSISISAFMNSVMCDNSDVELEPGFFLGDKFSNIKVNGRESSRASTVFLGGFLESVEDVVVERESDNGEVEEVVVGQYGYLAPGAFSAAAVTRRTKSMVAPGKMGEYMSYDGDRFTLYQSSYYSDNVLSDIFSRWDYADSEILEAGYAMEGGFAFLTQYCLYFIPDKEDRDFSGMGIPDQEKIPLKELYKEINPEIDMTPRDLIQDEEEPESESNPQKMEIAKIEGTAGAPTGAYGDAYGKSDDQLLDGLDSEAVDKGIQSSQDSVEAGIPQTVEYDRGQLEQDGLVVGDTVMSPSMEVNPEMYDAKSFMAYGDGLLVTSPGSGIVYKPFDREAVQVFGYPMYRTWKLSGGGFVSIGFDDNSKNYLQSDMPFAKVYYLELE